MLHIAVKCLCSKGISFLSFIFFSFFSIQSSFAQEPLKLFIYAGQSNAQGELTGENREVFPPSPFDIEIRYAWNLTGGEVVLNPGWSTLRKVPMGSGRITHAGEITLGREVYGAGLEELGIIKVTNGGTSLNLHWDPSSTLPGAQDDFGMYPEMTHYVYAKLAELDALGIPYQLEALFWHQGEGDTSPSFAAMYEENLQELIDSLKSDFSPTMQIYLASIYNPTKDPADVALVRQAQLTATANNSQVFFVDLDSIYYEENGEINDQYVKGDGIHYRSEGYLRIGETFAQAYLTNNPVQPCEEVLDPDIFDQLSVIETSASDCGGLDGSIEVQGNTLGLVFSINGGQSFQSSPVFSNLNPGNYTLVIQDASQVGCTKDYPNNPIGISDLPFPTIDAIESVLPSECGGSDGSISVVATGENLEYSLDGNVFQNTSTFVSLPANTYTVYVRELSTPMCMTSSQVVIDSSESCSPNDCATPINLALNKSSAQSSTYGDGLASFANDGNTFGNDNWGGDANMQHTQNGAGAWWKVDLGLVASLDRIEIYNRSTASSGLLGRLNNFYVLSSTSDIDYSRGLNALTNDPAIFSAFFQGNAGAVENIPLDQTQGRYVMIALTGNGPLHMAEVEVYGCDGPPPPPPSCDIVLSGISSSDESNCGAQDGTISIDATGSDIEFSINGGLSYQTTSIFSDLSAGSYEVKIRKMGLSNCEESYGANPVIIGAPAAPVISNVSSTNPSECELLDGSISISASGSNLEYSIGGNFQVGNSFSGLSEGTYTLTVRDGNNNACLASTSVTLAGPAGCEAGGNCSSPVNLALNKPVAQSSTYGDGLASFANDGNTTGNDNWGGDANLQHTQNGLGTWWKVDLGEEATLDRIEIYNRTTTSANLLQRLKSFYVFVSQTNIDGNRSLSELSTDGNIASTFFSGVAGAVESLSLNQIQGRYIMIALEGNGPLHMAEVEVYGCAGPPPPPPVCDIALLGLSNLNESDCGSNDGSILINATGNNVEYSINGGSSYQASNEFADLSAGSYTVMIREEGLSTCTESYEANPVVIGAPSAPSISNVLGTDQTDCDLSDGTLTIVAIGNNLEYSIGSAFQASNVFQGLGEGIYTISVRDAANISCVATTTAIISKPSGCESVECISPVNLARLSGVSISQSSTYGDGIASLAIDGNTSGNDPWGSDADLQHTQTEVGAWLKLDLGQIGNITSISLFNRDVLQFRLSNFYVFLSLQDIDPSRPIQDLESDAAIESYHFSGTAGGFESLPFDQVDAEFILLKLGPSSRTNPLHIAEIEVNGCPSASSQSANSSLREGSHSIEKLEELSLSVFPNPVIEQGILTVTGVGEKGAIIQVLNATGQVVQTKRLAPSGKMKIFENLAIGIYAVQLLHGDKVEVIKVFKAR